MKNTEISEGSDEFMAQNDKAPLLNTANASIAPLEEIEEITNRLQKIKTQVFEEGAAPMYAGSADEPESFIGLQARLYGLSGGRARQEALELVRQIAHKNDGRFIDSGYMSGAAEKERAAALNRPSHR